jgi:RNA polymerase sigma-70 factor (ECF subfamily)
VSAPSSQEFEKLALPILDFLLGMAVQMTRDRSSAEDLVQESLLKALRAFESFRSGSNFRAWVARILVNTFLTERRKTQRWASEVELESLPDPGAASRAESSLPHTEVRKLEEIPREAFSDEVLQAFRALPSEMALAVYLADVEELSYEEIAEIMGTPIGTVRSRISRGRRLMQARLVDLAREQGIIGRTS